LSLDFVLVEKPNSLAYFKQAERIYLDSFPVSQIRPTKMITRMLEFDPNYHLLVAREDDFIVGFSLLYAFNELNAAFLDFMAINKTYRGRSIGSELFRYTLNVSRQLVMDSIGVFFEVERESPIEHDTERFKYRRVRFYKRHGAKVFENVHYMLPDLHGGEPEDMYLMIIPNREIAYLERRFVFRAIKSIYLTMYHCCDELDLLDFTINGLPPRIRLT
jgi:GNAT superfamily N-acetyltransferase